MTTGHTLATIGVSSIDKLASPNEKTDITLASSALEIFTDFKKQRPLVIEESTSITEAKALMKKAHVKLKLVLGVSGEFVGTISYGDLSGQRYMESLGKGIRGSDITVKDVMVPHNRLRAISFDTFGNASISDVVETLKKEHCRHFLIIEQEQHRIRGIVSAGDIARRLHIEIEITPSLTFEEIYFAITSTYAR